MSGRQLLDWIAAAAERLVGSRDELTDLDAATGDGDLGVTVASGATEVIKDLAALDPATPPAGILRVAGAAFARGNPSSFAALTGAGLLAAASALDGITEFDQDAVGRALQAAADRISERGRSAVGQRTLLDALVPSTNALRDAAPGVQAGLAAMVSGAREGVSATADMTPAKGRALWVGERARGIPDGGATAYLRFLEALAETQPAALNTGD